jgi:protein tyrosine phosphatase (PTP) superfamily phosphohydrolase (DUF442 family)
MEAPPAILNWLPWSDRVTTSGQPSEEQLAELRASGAEVIINLGLHTHPNALSDEEGAVTSLGMSYIHIPVDFEAPTEADYERFRATMDAGEARRVHVHCIVNARVTAFLYRYQQERLGVSEPEARAFMEQVWKPGGAWAAFLGDEQSVGRDHQYARRDY